jgi:hypothetical protein
LLSLTLGAASTISAASDEVPFPNGFRDWFAVNSMIVTKDSPLSAQIGGLHIIHVNATALPVLKKGGPFPYPDGTVFADDVHDFSVKDSKKYTATGGWGFQAWAGGDPSKPLIPDTAHAIQACFVCHSPQQPRDFVFSTYVP